VLEFSPLARVARVAPCLRCTVVAEHGLYGFHDVVGVHRSHVRRRSPISARRRTLCESTSLVVAPPAALCSAQSLRASLHATGRSRLQARQQLRMSCMNTLSNSSRRRVAVMSWRTQASTVRPERAGRDLHTVLRADHALAVTVGERALPVADSLVVCAARMASTAPQ